MAAQTKEATHCLVPQYADTPPHTQARTTKNSAVHMSEAAGQLVDSRLNSSHAKGLHKAKICGE